MTKAAIASVLVLSLLALSNADASPFNIVATGDSNTLGYAPILLGFAMKAQGLDLTDASAVASGGATSERYTGQQIDPVTDTEHDFAKDAIQGPVVGFGGPYGSAVNDAPNPNAVIVMIGTNDAFGAAGALSPDVMFQNYQQNMTAVFDFLSTARDPDGTRPSVFVATLLPILPNPSNSQYEAANARIDNVWNPWLRSETAAFGFHLIDVNRDIQQVPNWQSFYSDDGVTPGYVHLNANAGYTWLAQEVVYHVLDAHAGDANLDGRVTGADYTAWAHNFHQHGVWTQGDFNHDGVVDAADYTVWADHFQSSAAALSVPEPASLLLALYGIAGMIFFARCRSFLSST